MKPLRATFVLSASRAAQFPSDGLPEVAFLGRSNVGKSSLLNALVGVKGLARVSGTPGRTQLVNFFRVEDRLYLVDLPGYGYAKVPEAVRQSWEALVTSYLLDRAPLAAAVLIVDARHEPQEGDRTLRAWLDHHQVPYLVAANKSDKLGRAELSRRMAALERDFAVTALGLVAVSAETKAGVDVLWREVQAAAAGHAVAEPAEDEA